MNVKTIHSFVTLVKVGKWLQIKCMDWKIYKVAQYFCAENSEPTKKLWESLSLFAF